MIDLQTTQIIGAALTVIEALLGVLIWVGHRNMAGIGRLAFCFTILPFGHILMMFFRTPLGIVLGNCGVNLSVILYAVGLAQLLERPRIHAWTVPATLFGTAMIWSAALLLDPTNALIRITAVMCFDVAVSLWMLTMLWQDRPLPILLKAVLAAIIASYDVAQILRVVEGWQDGNQALLTHPIPSWIILLGILYSNCMFFCAIAIIARKILGHSQQPPVSGLLPSSDAAPTASAEISAEWRLFAATWEVVPPNNISVKLTATEYSLLSTLAEQEPGVPLSREEIFTRLPRNGLNSPTNLDALVRRVRKKIKDGSDVEIPLKTIYGVGYTLTVPVRQTAS